MLKTNDVNGAMEKARAAIKEASLSNYAEWLPEQKGNECWFCESEDSLCYIRLTIDSQTTRYLWLCPKHLKGVLKYSAELASACDWEVA